MDLEIIKNEMKLYKHKTNGIVRFNEVDMFSVVHNIQYFYWLEWARTEYMNEITKTNIAVSAKRDNLIYMVVHSEIDYFQPARYLDEYETLTRLSVIRNSSAQLDNIIRLKNGDPIAKASAIIVHVNSKTMEKTRIPDAVRKLIFEYEPAEVLIGD